MSERDGESYETALQDTSPHMFSTGQFVNATGVRGNMKTLAVILLSVLFMGCAAQYDVRIIGLMHAGYTPLYGPDDGTPAVVKYEGNVAYRIQYGEGETLKVWPSWRAVITVANPHAPFCITYDTLITAINTKELLLKIEAWKARQGIAPHITLRGGRGR